MIEIERKFKATADQKNALLHGATFVSKKTFTDRYFDDADFRLTTKDIWFRDRDGVYELKYVVSGSDRRMAERYHELDTESEIADYFGWDLSQKSFEEWIKESGLSPFASITTTREKYTRDGFTIDIDTTDTGFNIMEIELLVEDEHHIPEAEQKICTFAETHGLDTNTLYVRGKLIDYLEQNSPHHFQKLVDAGVVR